MFVYFLKLSNISRATHFHQSQNASHPARANIAMNQLSIVVVTSVAIPTWSKTAITVKNIIIHLEPVATILAVSRVLIPNAYKIIS